MRRIEVPYGDGAAACVVDEARPVTVLRARPFPAAGADGAALVRESLTRPVGSPPLSALAREARSVVVITSDHTRPVPSRVTLPPLLAEIRRGRPDADITVLIATGCHRAMSAAEIEAKFGADLARRERIINHDAQNERELVSLGALPSGGELLLNRRAAEAGLLVAEGFIEPHQLAGFSGGRKSVLPGVAGLRTVLASHNAEFTVHPRAVPGALDGNPFHADMLFAAKKARLAFILNVVLDAEKRIAASFAGGAEAAHRAGCDYALKYYGVRAARAPVVISSSGGYPFDQNIYQATKAMVAGSLACGGGSGAAPNGVIICCCECRDGHGGEHFYRALGGAAGLKTLLAEIAARGRDGTRADQWATQLAARVLDAYAVILVSAAPPEMVERLHMRSAPDLQTALALADGLLGRSNAPLAVLPEALSLVIEPEAAPPASA